MCPLLPHFTAIMLNLASSAGPLYKQLHQNYIIHLLICGQATKIIETLSHLQYESFTFYPLTKYTPNKTIRYF